MKEIIRRKRIKGNEKISPCSYISECLKLLEENARNREPFRYILSTSDDSFQYFNCQSVVFAGSSNNYHGQTETVIIPLYAKR